MFSIVKGEEKIIDSHIETIPDLWMRGKNTGKFFLCPLGLSRQSFSNAVRNQFAPISNWRKIKCQVLESKFSKYKQIVDIFFIINYAFLWWNYKAIIGNLQQKS